jgi:hypothetical protein
VTPWERELVRIAFGDAGFELVSGEGDIVTLSDSLILETLGGLKEVVRAWEAVTEALRNPPVILAMRMKDEKRATATADLLRERLVSYFAFVSAGVPLFPGDTSSLFELLAPSDGSRPLPEVRTSNNHAHAIHMRGAFIVLTVCYVHCSPFLLAHVSSPFLFLSVCLPGFFGTVSPTHGCCACFCRWR